MYKIFGKCLNPKERQWYRVARSCENDDHTNNGDNSKIALRSEVEAMLRQAHDHNSSNHNTTLTMIQSTLPAWKRAHGKVNHDRSVQAISKKSQEQ